MANFDQFEFYKELYFKENERRSSIDGALNVPIVVTTALVAGIYILATTYSRHVDEWVTNGFFTLLIISFFFLGVSIYWICTVFVSQGSFFFSTNPPQYGGIPFADPLFQWHGQMEQYYRTHFASDPNVQNMADDAFREYLVSQFITSLDRNTHANDNKFSQLFNANKWLVRSLMFCGFSIPIYAYSFFTKPETVFNTKISGDSLNVYIIDKKHVLIEESNEQSAKQSPTAADLANSKSIVSSQPAAKASAAAGKIDKRRSGVSKTPRMEGKIKSNYNGRRKQTCAKGDTTTTDPTTGEGY
ncbi:MAG: Yip1 family protein [Dyadobacter sp.]|uniref:Yip1 family protein n=1 Tax=Dyadobacter sp. TaxID=1914288 RepID=UPI0032666233